MKTSICLIGIVAALVAVSVSPALAGTGICGTTIDVTEGQTVKLEGVPSLPSPADWYYMWTGQYDSGTDDPLQIEFLVPPYDSMGTNQFTETLTVSNQLWSGTCLDYCTVTFNIKEKSCPLPGDKACRDGSYPTDTDASWMGIDPANYRYHWVIPDGSGGETYINGPTDNPTYMLEWSELPQSSPSDAEVCTDVTFYITTTENPTHRFAECTGTYCIYEEPAVDILKV